MTDKQMIQHVLADESIGSTPAAAKKMLLDGFEHAILSPVGERHELQEALLDLIEKELTATKEVGQQQHAAATSEAEKTEEEMTEAREACRAAEELVGSTESAAQDKTDIYKSKVKEAASLGKKHATQEKELKRYQAKTQERKSNKETASLHLTEVETFEAGGVALTTKIVTFIKAFAKDDTLFAALEAVLNRPYSSLGPFGVLSVNELKEVLTTFITDSETALESSYQSFEIKEAEVLGLYAMHQVTIQERDAAQEEVAAGMEAAQAAVVAFDAAKAALKVKEAALTDAKVKETLIEDSISKVFLAQEALARLRAPPTTEVAEEEMPAAQEVTPGMVFAEAEGTEPVVKEPEPIQKAFTLKRMEPEEAEMLTPEKRQKVEGIRRREAASEAMLRVASPHRRSFGGTR